MKVIVAIDDSPAALKVLKETCEQSWDEGTQFKLLHVIEPIELEPDGEQPPAKARELLSANRRNVAVRLCEQMRHRLQRALHTEEIHFEIREGKPDEEIVKAASEWPADLILIGAKGKTSCPHFLLGSVSRSVSKQAACKVQVVQEQQTSSFTATA